MFWKKHYKVRLAFVTKIFTPFYYFYVLIYCLNKSSITSFFPADIMQYEADQNMVFNYLMVSGLAAATDLFEKNGTGMTGGKSFNHFYCMIV